MSHFKNSLTGECYIDVKEYLSAINTWTTDTYNNVDESQMCYAQWKKSDSKEYILY